MKKLIKTLLIILTILLINLFIITKIIQVIHFYNHPINLSNDNGYNKIEWYILEYYDSLNDYNYISDSIK